MEASCRDLLIQLILHPTLHAKFLNSLSLLEYIGARKMLKSQLQERVTSALLDHVAEEVRHAQLLKRLALKLSDNALSTYHHEQLLAGQEAVRYFQSVDQGVATALSVPDRRACYLYVTLVIEERAMQFYPIYAQVLQGIGWEKRLDALLKDEEHHLQSITQLLKDAALWHKELLDRLRTLEATAFARFIAAVREAVVRGG